MYIIKNKWSTTKKQMYNAQKYDSGFEAHYAMELDARQKAGDILRWERQVKIPLEVNGYHIANYYIDFIVYHNNGEIEYVETKGMPTEVWKLKWKIFEATYSDLPGVLLTVVKQKTNWGMRKIKKIT